MAGFSKPIPQRQGSSLGSSLSSSASARTDIRVVFKSRSLPDRSKKTPSIISHGFSNPIKSGYQSRPQSQQRTTPPVVEKIKDWRLRGSSPWPVPSTSHQPFPSKHSTTQGVRPNTSPPPLVDQASPSHMNKGREDPDALLNNVQDREDPDAPDNNELDPDGLDSIVRQASQSVYSEFDDNLSNPFSNLNLDTTESHNGHVQRYIEMSKTAEKSYFSKKRLRQQRSRWRDDSVRLLILAIANHTRFDDSFGKIQAWLQVQPKTHPVDKARLRRSRSAVKDKAVNLKKLFLLHDKNLPGGFDIINLPERVMHTLVMENKNPNRREAHNGEAGPRCTVVRKGDKEKFNKLLAAQEKEQAITMREYKDLLCFQ